MQLKTKLTLFSGSFLLIMATQIASSILGPLQQEFPDVPNVTIQLVFSVVGLLCGVASLTCGFVVRNKKRAVLLGVCLFTFGGLLCGFAPSIPVLLIFRMISGIGAGILNPMINSYLSDLSTPEEYPRVMSISGTICQMGSVVAIWGAGQLAMISWRAAFALFLLGFIPLVLVPKNLPAVYVSQENRPRFSFRSIPGSVWILGAIHLVIGMIYNTTFTNISIWMTDNGFTSAQSGLAIALSALGSMCFCWTAPFFLKHFRKYIATFFWLVIALMFFLISRSTTVFTIGLWMFIMGICGCVMGISIMMMALQIADKDNSITFSSILIGANSLGCFLCAYVFDWTGKLLGNSDIPFGFTVNAVESVVIAAVCFVIFQKLRQEPVKRD